MIQNADWVIDKLKLDIGFDSDRIDLGNFDELKMVSFATILLGGFLIVTCFPSFIGNCYLAFKGTVETKGLQNNYGEYSERANYFDWGIAVMNLINGYLLLSNYGEIGTWITKTNMKNSVN